ncbi:MAG: hypothetical protein D6E12_07355 [Desulfovibrio sp.]|nr:MAG: hypothetical protein D6E12_07355 [Desulfovibrio sp.]
MYYNGSQRHKIRINKLMARNHELEMAITDLKAEIEVLKAEQKAFSGSDPAFPEVSVPTSAMSAMDSPAQDKQASVVAVLLKEGKISREQVAKAEMYKKENSSPYPLEEILMLLNMVDPAVVREVRSRS